VTSSDQRYDSSRLGVVDSARLFALVAVARADSLIAVFDAKYHYNFWRPMTAIRHGDNDENPRTERDPTWLPIAETPMHPEYPCTPHHGCDYVYGTRRGDRHLGRGSVNDQPHSARRDASLE
jgi:hypothetical protein